VVLDEKNMVLEAGAAADLIPRHAGLTIERVRGVVFPGLVNAHTHVELSALRGHVAGGAGFVPWVERLLCARVDVMPEEDGEAIARAVEELTASGTVAVGDVT